MKESSLRNAVKANRISNRYQVIEEDNNLSVSEYDAVVNKWATYPNKGYISGATLGLLSTEDNALYENTLNKINDKMAVEIPKFINGTYDVYGADWDTFCKTLNKMGHEKVTTIIQDLFNTFD